MRPLHHAPDRENASRAERYRERDAGSARTTIPQKEKQGKQRESG